MSVNQYTIELNDQLSTPLQQIADLGDTVFTKLNSGQQMLNQTLNQYTLALGSDLSNPMQQIAALGSALFSNFSINQETLNHQTQEGNEATSETNQVYKPLAGIIDFASKAMLQWNNLLKSAPTAMNDVEGANSTSGNSFVDFVNKARAGIDAITQMKETYRPLSNTIDMASSAMSNIEASNNASGKSFSNLSTFATSSIGAIKKVKENYQPFGAIIDIAATSLQEWMNKADAEPETMKSMEASNNASGKSFSNLLTFATSSIGAINRVKENYKPFGAVIDIATSSLKEWMNKAGAEPEAMKNIESSNTSSGKSFHKLSTNTTKNITAFEKVKKVIQPLSSLIGLSGNSLKKWNQEAQTGSQVMNALQAPQSFSANSVKSISASPSETQNQSGEEVNSPAIKGFGQVKQLLSSVKELQEKSGNLFGPALEGVIPFADWMQKAASGTDLLLSAVDSGQAIFETFNAVTQAATAIGQALNGVMNTQLIISKANMLITKMWSGIQLVFNSIMAMNPIALVVISLAALTAGVIYAWNKFAGFRGAILGIWEVIKGFGRILKIMVIDRFKEMISGLGTLGKALGALFKGNWSEAGNFAATGLKQMAGTESIKKAYQEGTKLKESFNNGMAKGATAGKITNPLDKIMGGKEASAKPITAPPGQEPGLANSTDAQTGIAGITGGGARQTNINVTLSNLIESFSINSETVSEGADEMREIVTEQLLRVLNSSNRLSYQQ